MDKISDIIKTGAPYMDGYKIYTLDTMYRGKPAQLISSKSGAALIDDINYLRDAIQKTSLQKVHFKKRMVKHEYM